jgi:hypothetical protein
VDTIEDRERGRELYTAHAWKRAYESLSSADLKRPLEAPDLEFGRLAALKARYDPENRFRSNRNIAPAAGEGPGASK